MLTQLLGAAIKIPDIYCQLKYSNITVSNTLVKLDNLGPLFTDWDTFIYLLYVFFILVEKYNSIMLDNLTISVRVIHELINLLLNSFSVGVLIGGVM